MTEGKVTVTFKVSGGTQFDMELLPSMTIQDVKNAAEEKCDLKAEHQRLIYKGRILKDADTIETLKVADGHTMHLVKGAGAASTPAAQPSDISAETNAPSVATADISGNAAGTIPSMGNMFPGGGADLPAMLSSPMIQEMMRSLQSGGGMPAGMAQGMNSGGMPGAMGGGAPSAQFVSQMLNNPMVQNLMQQLMNNPELMRTMLQNNPLFSQLGGAAVGQTGADPAAATNRMMDPQMMQSLMQAMGGTGAMGGMPGAPTAGAPDNTNEQPNQMNPFFQMMMNQNSGFGGANVPTDTRPPNERFAVQLSSLRDMGFIDNDANIQALQQSDGDVNTAITRLLERGVGN
eukprot:GHVL01044995.1.p1 GENE.GHVL01044995.1~~GHVL01044995.1.p1  ORF type:complete len:361 (+),score=70.30 GHVL01044995.1:47-1084(+)